jgi:hypothetical protein
MNQTLEETIIKQAPYMFRYDGWDNLNESLMGFGFECGNGWYKILLKLVKRIKEIDVKQSIQVVQIKEKFRGLRFYYNLKDYDLVYMDKIDECIRDAEEEAWNTCEICGSEIVDRKRCECLISTGKTYLL